MAKKPSKVAEKDLEDFDDEGPVPGEAEGVEDKPGPGKQAAPEPVVKKKKKEATAGEEAQKVKPRKAYILDAKGQPKKDEDGDLEEYAPGFHKQIGFVSQNGILFPVGFKFKGGHVGWRGNVVLNRCPLCRHKQMVDEAVQGVCANQKAPPSGEPCGYSAIADLEDYELEE